MVWICFMASRGKGIFAKEKFSDFFFDRKNEKYFSENGEKHNFGKDFENPYQKKSKTYFQIFSFQKLFFFDRKKVEKIFE